MGSIQRRPNGQWRARVRVDGREVARHFPRKVDAERWVTTQESKKLSGEWTHPKDGKVTVEQYGEAWRALLHHRESTSAKYETNLRRHVYPTLGRRPLGALRPTELQAWIKHLQGKLAPGTVAVVVDTMRAMLHSAVRDRMMGSNPMDGIKTPRPEKHLVRPLSPAEVAGLIGAVPERYRAVVVLGAGCGLRVSEVLALTPADVDFLRRKVRVERQLIRSANGSPYRFGPPKSRASRREVPLPHPVALELAAHMERRPPVEVEGLGVLIFTGDRGLPIGRELIGRTVATAGKRAGLPAGVRFHDLRHHYASLLIGSGLSVKAVQTALGHSNAAETLNTYAHLWPAEEDAMAAAVAKAWGAAPSLRAVEG